MFKDTLRLFMIELGCKPKGRTTEQHDIFFGVGTSIDDPNLHKQIRLFWPEGAKNLHIDGYRIVRQVGDYAVRIHEKGEKISTGVFVPAKKSLFFANLGGYKMGKDGESHKRLLLVLDNIMQVKGEAMKDSFVKEMDKIPGAPPHRDDELQLSVDVEDETPISDLLKDHKILLYYHLDKESSLWQHTGYKPVQV